MADLQDSYVQDSKMPPKVPHFAEPWVAPTEINSYLPEREYGMALDALVIACVDIVLVQGKTVLLGQRRQPPRADWWLVGGRMMRGESPLQAVQRKVKEEAGLILQGDRFHYLGAYSTFFAERSQPPQQHGLHSVNLTYMATISEAEQYAVALTPTEYEDYRWFTQSDLERMLGKDSELAQNFSNSSSPSSIDNCLRQICHDLWSQLKGQ
jgi:ADP-ribose pyrophosphatase YjhB (NUDIX family)